MPDRADRIVSETISSAAGFVRPEDPPREIEQFIIIFFKFSFGHGMTSFHTDKSRGAAKGSRFLIIIPQICENRNEKGTVANLEIVSI